MLGEHLMSWSKTGIIAYSDSQSSNANICLTFLESINGINWRFHTPQKYVLHPQLHEVQYQESSSTPSTHSTTTSVNGSTTAGVGSTPNFGGNSNKSPPQFFYNISSIHWNNWFSLPGDMLAVCDELGNMTMLITGQRPDRATTYEKLTMVFQDNVYKIYNHVMPLKPVDKLKPMNIERKQTRKEYNTSILEFRWLTSSKSVIVSQFCAFDSSSNTYRSRAQQVPPYGVYHPPFIKYACLAIRKNGQIDFWYQFSNSKDHKKITLQLLDTSNQRFKDLQWLEFARITPMNDDQCMLITTYSKLSKNISFYKLHVNWNLNATKPNVLNDPSLKIQFILSTTLDPTDDEGHVLKLENLHVVSKSSIEKDPSPEILVLYNVCNTSKSLVKRYRLAPTQLSAEYLVILKPDLNIDRNNSTNQIFQSRRYNLRRHSDIVLDKKVTLITSEMFDGFVSFYFEDGTIESYNQNDWKLETERLISQSQLGKFKNIIASPLSAGFDYGKLPLPPSVEWMKVSPSMCGVIVKQYNKKWPQFYAAVQKNYADPEKDSINATALAFGYVKSLHKQISAEDLTIAAKTHILRISFLDRKRAKEFITTLLKSLYSFFNISPDAPKEIMDKIITSRPLQKIMLLQLELGSCFSQENIEEMARVILYLKNVLFAFNGVARNFHFAIEQISNNSNQQQNPKLFQTIFSKQDLIHSLIPVAKWFVKFITYLTQEILILINDPTNKEYTLVHGIFGAKMSRTLILSILNEIKKVTQIVAKFPETSYPILNESSTFLKLVLSESPVDFEKFETFLVDVNNKFIALCEQQPSQEREFSLLVKAEIPPEYAKVGDFLLQYANNAVISHANAAAVYFADTSGLKISNSEFFNPEIFHLLQPLEEGLIIDTDKLPIKNRTSKSFSKLLYDDVTCDKLSVSEISDGKLKRCSRCGSVTRAGNIISSDKTIVPTSIQTKRWPTMYTRLCICSGMLFEMDG